MCDQVLEWANKLRIKNFVLAFARGSYFSYCSMAISHSQQPLNFYMSRTNHISLEETQAVHTSFKPYKAPVISNGVHGNHGKPMKNACQIICFFRFFINVGKSEYNNAFSEPCNLISFSSKRANLAATYKLLLLD